MFSPCEPYEGRAGARTDCEEGVARSALGVTPEFTPARAGETSVTKRSTSVARILVFMLRETCKARARALPSYLLESRESVSGKNVTIVTPLLRAHSLANPFSVSTCHPRAGSRSKTSFFFGSKPTTTS